MSTLPDALRPWREWLNWFDPDLAVQLGSLLQRLHPLFGPFRGSSQGGEPELEGLDDLRPRGSYDHLLATEWLLADEMPDEFLRRAASGEHIFLAPRPKARRADRSIIALFDTGPLQFGAPRLAHLAIWILLARRARQVQGEFRWGSLQTPGELSDSLTSGNLLLMLKRRTFDAADSEHLVDWRRALEEKGTGGECWMIGPSFAQPELLLAPAFTHRVSLERDLPGNALDVSMFERGAERSLNLPLPEPNSVAPLLRGYFARQASPNQYSTDPHAVALSRPPVISFDGNRVAVALRDEPAALVFIVPRTIKDQPATPRYQRWTAGYSALAISFIGKRMGVLLSGEKDLRFWGSSMAMSPCPTQEEFHAPGSTAAWLSLAWLQSGKMQRLCVIDQSKRLLVWESVYKQDVAAKGRLQVLQQNVLGLVQVNRGLAVYAFHEKEAVWCARGILSGTPEAPRIICNAPADAEVLFGRGQCCAVRVDRSDGESWYVGVWGHGHGYAGIRIKLPPDSRAIGVMREPKGRISLVTLDRNILRMHFTGGGNQLLYEAPERIVSCTMCPITANIAILTERRQFIVVSALLRDLRISVQTGRPHASA